MSDTEVLLLPYELLAVLDGRHIVTGTTDGGEVTVRLFTAEEWLTAQHAAADKVAADLIGAGYPPGDVLAQKIDLARAREMVRVR
jgi:hypothetical protein